MCIDCWENYGSPAIVNERTRKGSELIDRVYEFNGAGGNLHIQLDDWNLENFAGPFKLYLPASDMEPGQEEAERECYDYFCQLTVEERASALALNRGIIGWPC